ncbi:hypothetical protein LMH87_001261 [Akanthomyces muscarius]|uniref:Uncharacterized protein n=1 Tax=Akanthomyces muscarius TaxID=2231603 RepID=A0A9W8QII5_AKAMU|nr:hypothetical protein LMH87_001261 [Akanthomyces muscarius]KAJ4156047.1 hypothetical protein LMH87_001261 [Akanthomyces muscarius]
MADWSPDLLLLVNCRARSCRYLCGRLPYSPLAGHSLDVSLVLSIEHFRPLLDVSLSTNPATEDDDTKTARAKGQVNQNETEDSMQLANHPAKYE